MAFSAALRLRAGRSPLRGGAEHLSLRLLARGWRTTAVVAAAALVSVALGVLGFVAVTGPALGRVLGYRD